MGAGRARQAFPPSAHPLAAAGEQVLGGRLRGAETEVGTGVCAARASLERRSAPKPRWASHVLGHRGGSAGAGPVSSEVQARGCSARGRAAGLVRDSNSRPTPLLAELEIQRSLKRLGVSQPVQLESSHARCTAARRGESPGAQLWGFAREERAGPRTHLLADR